MRNGTAATNPARMKLDLVLSEENPDRVLITTVDKRLSDEIHKRDAAVTNTRGKTKIGGVKSQTNQTFLTYSRTDMKKRKLFQQQVLEYFDAIYDVTLDIKTGKVS